MTSRPRTEAGRALLEAEMWLPTSHPMTAILAIEAEAADLAVAERLAELRAAVEGLRNGDQLPAYDNVESRWVERAAVLALLGSPQPPEAGL